MIPITELYWAAGFLEGEGCFSVHGTAYDGVKISPRVSAPQVQKEPLLRLQNIFGGDIRLRSNARMRALGKPHNDVWEWRVGGGKAVGVMLTLWSLLSAKRKSSIEKAIHAWRPRGSSAMRLRGLCVKHGRAEVRYRPDSRPYCLACTRAQRVLK